MWAFHLLISALAVGLLLGTAAFAGRSGPVRCGRKREQAAEMLGVAQPTLSKQVHTLEGSLGAPLFERIRGGVILTAALGYAVAAASGLSYQFSPRFGMFGYARYERLVGDGAKSPIVRELGSRNQLSAGIGLSYTFTVER